MYISKIQTCDAEDREADVFVSDGINTLLCYVYPAKNIKPGMDIRLLSCFGCSDILAQGTDTVCTQMKRSDIGFYAYTIVAQIVSMKENTVKTGEFYMQLDSCFPGDCKTGDIVSFSVTRIDAVTNDR